MAEAIVIPTFLYFSATATLWELPVYGARYSHYLDGVFNK